MSLILTRVDVLPPVLSVKISDLWTSLCHPMPGNIERAGKAKGHPIVINNICNQKNSNRQQNKIRPATVKNKQIFLQALQEVLFHAYMKFLMMEKICCVMSRTTGCPKYSSQCLFIQPAQV